MWRLINSLRHAGDWRLKWVLLGLAITGTSIFALLVLVLYIAILYPSTQVATHAPENTIYYLDQGWGWTASSELRQRFYYTAQGTSLQGFRYKWLVHLEHARENERFAEPTHMRALGFLVDNTRTPKNPDQLPVGFTRHYDPQYGEDVLDITCAACHSGELHVFQNGEPVAVRIDGGQAMHAFTSMSIGQFGPALLTSMAATFLHPYKFDRFARNVLGDRYETGKSKLRWQFAGVLFSFLSQAASDKWHNLYPVEEGFGRTDAIGRISNTVFGIELNADNYRLGNAPVSYPAIWDAPKFDWVQYAGSVSQPMARNLGESLGVGAKIELTDVYGLPLPADRRYSSAAIVENLKTIEETIRVLKPPRWPDQIFGKIDTEKAAAGRKLFVKHCQGCHEPCLKSAEDIAIEKPLLKPPDQLWHVNLLPVQDIGTDPTAALNFYSHRVNLKPTGMTDDEMRPMVEKILKEQQRRKIEYAKQHHLPPVGSGECEIKQQLDAINVRSVSIGAGLHLIGMLLRERYYTDNHFTEQQRMDYDGYGSLDLPQVKLVYKARPLAGVWATAPYLHNGSVPNLYEMLAPASQRSKRFFISQMDFDPVRVGLVKEPLSEHGFWYDTSITGNLNIGHEFRAGYGGYTPGGPPQYGVIGPELTDAERWALIEYLKIHEDQPGPCAAQAPPPPPVPCKQ